MDIDKAYKEHVKEQEDVISQNSSKCWIFINKKGLK